MSTFHASGLRGGGSGILAGVVPPGLVKSLSLPHTDFSKKAPHFYPEMMELHSPVFALEIAEGSQERTEDVSNRKTDGINMHIQKRGNDRSEGQILYMVC